MSAISIDISPTANYIQIAPTAPSSLTATADGGYTRIKLAWTDNSDNEDGFKIERSPDDAAWVQIDTVAANVTYYTDTGLTRGSTYYYRVRAYEGAFNGAYTSSANATIWALTDVTLFADYDPNNDAYEDASGVDPCEDGDGVYVLKDQANSYDLTQATAAARPTWETNELNSLPVIRHASGDILQAATASDWKFLHDGTEFGVYIVWKATSADPDAAYVLLDNHGTSSSNIGFSLFYDDRVSQSREDVMVSFIAKGAVGNMEGEPVTTTEAAEGAEWHVTAVRFDGTDHAIWNDGHYGGYGEDAVDGSPSASNPTSVLTFGGTTSNTANLVGDWARVIFISGSISDANHQAMQDFLTETYDLFDNRWFGSESVVEHDTSGNDYNGFVGLGQAPNGDLIVGYNKMSAHAAFDGDLIIKISSDGGSTWGSEIVVWDYSDPSEGNNTDCWHTPRFTVIGTTVWMAVGLRVSSAAAVDGIGYFTSSDNGATWSGLTQLTEATFTEVAVEGGGILELASGDLLYPYYGTDIGDSYLSVRVLRSQNGGSTWSNLATIADGETDTLEYTETGLIQISNDDVLAIIRYTPGGGITNDKMYISVSTDDGATWGSTSEVASASGLPTPLLLSTGEIIAPQRNIEGVPFPTQILFSGDEGASFQMGWQFAGSPNFSDGFMVYGQFVEDPDGTVYIAYGTENTTSTIADVMFAKTG
jgi:hypothetical protein